MDTPTMEVRSRWRWVRGLLAVLFVPLMFLSLGAAARVPAGLTVDSWATAAELGTWTLNTASLASACAMGSDTDSECISFNNGTTPSAVSPSVTISSLGTYDLLVDCNATAGSLLTSSYVVVSGDATHYAFSDASGLSGCTSAPFTISAGGSYTFTVQSPTLTTGQGVQVGDVRLEQLTISGGGGGGSSGSLAFPLLDLASISSNVGLFFSFMSPLLWILLGIGVAGIILARARNFV